MPSHSSFEGHQSYACKLWNKVQELQGRKKQTNEQQQQHNTKRPKTR